jgi:hypothetical protein
MKDFEVRQFQKTRSDVKGALSLTSLDLERGGWTPEETKIEYDPTVAAYQERQKTLIEASPESYLGAFDSTNHMLGMIVMKDLRYGDMKPYVSIREYLHLRKIAGENGILPSQTKYITSFVAESIPEHDEVLEQLIAQKLIQFEAHDIVISHFAKDPSRRITNRHGFVPTGQNGVNFKMKQDLYIKVASNPN